MKRLKTMGVLLLALFAFSAVAATAAQAEEAPYWSIEGTRLAAGKTAEITAKAVGAPQKLGNGTQTLECTELELNKGAVLLGSNAGEPGRSDEIIVYKNCKVEGNGTKCAVEGATITTKALSNELAYAENKKSLVVEFTPITGKVLAEVKFKAETGGKCNVASTKITGLIVAKALTDPEANGETGEGVLLELPNTVKPSTSFLLQAPKPAIRTIWLIENGTGKSFTTEELNSFGAEAIYEGTALISLASGKKWSPLL